MKALRILLVEDEAIIAMLFADVLDGLGHDVCAIEATEDDAVAAAARCVPDLIIVDVNLGAGSGVSVVSKILETRYVPHVFITGDTSAALTVEAYETGSELIHKPVRVSDLARAIRRAAEARGPIANRQLRLLQRYP